MRQIILIMVKGIHQLRYVNNIIPLKTLKIAVIHLSIIKGDHLFFLVHYDIYSVRLIKYNSTSKEVLIVIYKTRNYYKPRL